MATDPRITGFDANDVRSGLRTAFRVGMPPIDDDQPTFYIPVTQPSQTEAVDEGGVPFDPSYVPPRTPPTAVKVDCSIEYVDGSGKLENFGVISPTKVILTLLDVDYAQVKGFSYVVISGTRFWYRRTETTHGLVSVGLYKVHCASEDEG